MDAFYVFLFALLATLCLALEWPARLYGTKATSPDRPAPPASFYTFRYNYLLVYSLMMGAPRVRPSAHALTHGRSGRLAAGAVRVRAVRSLWLHQARHWTPLHRRLRLLHDLRHRRRLAR